MSLTDIFKNPKAAAVGAGLGLLVALSPVKATIHNTPKVELAQAYAGDVKQYSNLESLLPKGYPVKDVVDVDKNNVRFEKNDREYIQFVKDNEGNPIMEVELQYIGKQPPQEIANKIPQNRRFWEKIDTDFYTISFMNDTNSSLEFLEMKQWAERGRLMTPSKETKEEYQKFLISKWGDYRISSNDRKSVIGFGYSDLLQDKCHQEISFRFGKKVFMANLAFDYIK